MENNQFKQIVKQRILHGSLVWQIVLGLIAGILLATFSPSAAKSAGLLGTLFVNALKSVAPILVLTLVAASIANHKQGQKTNIRSVLMLYIVGTFLAALIAVVMSFMFPTTLTLIEKAGDLNPPTGVIEVLQTVLLGMLTNPVKALLDANYLGILLWAIGLGIALRKGSDTTKKMMSDVALAVVMIVQVIVRFAPIGIFSLISTTLATEGFAVLLEYTQLLVILIGCMALVALVLNPALVFYMTRKNPYPLVWACLRESAVTAFMTRSSAANIPVNMELCEKLGLNKDTYSVSIPLGATINMAGAAVTITILTLATVNTLGIQVDIFTALLLSVVAAICACGASGVAGGSLLLIPMACSMFGIENDVAMQVVAVGFIIGVLQDSTETALNSSTDVLFTAAACYAEDRKKLELEDAKKLAT